MWPGLTKCFARVVTLDFPGCGFSDKPRHYRYSVQEQADLVTAVLGARGIRHVHVVAHGDGVHVVGELLARAQEEGAQADVPQVLSAMLLSARSEEHTSELQSLLRISYAVFCLKKKNSTIIK